MMAKKQKAKMGRPPKPPREKWGVKITVYMTDEERAALEREAEQAGLSLSAILMRPWRDKGE